MDKKTLLIILGALLIVLGFYLSKNNLYQVLAIASLLIGVTAMAIASLLEEEQKPIVEVRKSPGKEEILWLLPEKDRLIIGYLYKEEKVSQTELSKHTGIPKTTLINHLKSLEKEGKVKIEKGKTGNMISLTKKVRKLLDMF